MKIFLFVVLFNLSLSCSLLEDIYIQKGQKAYENKEYEKAYENFMKVGEKNDKLLYNTANTLYKLKKYKEAIEFYSKINDRELTHKKYHNIANCYASLGDYEKAIAFYKSALNFKADERTRFNLELSQNIQEKIMKKRSQEEEGKQIDTNLHREGAEIPYYDTENIEEDPKLSENKKTTLIKHTANIVNSIQKDKKGEIYIYEQEEEKKKIIKAEDKLQITNYQKQKWDNRLKENSINTLLVPFEKGIVDDSKYPW